MNNYPNSRRLKQLAFGTASAGVLGAGWVDFHSNTDNLGTVNSFYQKTSGDTRSNAFLLGETVGSLDVAKDVGKLTLSAYEGKTVTVSGIQCDVDNTLRGEVSANQAALQAAKPNLGSLDLPNSPSCIAGVLNPNQDANTVKVVLDEAFSMHRP